MSKFDPRRCRIILESIRSGQTKVVAARTGGVTVSCLERWLKDPRKTEFAEDYSLAEAEAEQSLVEIVREHAKKDWKSAKWLLTRRYPHWQEESKTTQTNRDRLDELRIRKAELEVQFGSLRLEALKAADGDMDLLAVLNEAPALMQQSKQPN
jgi:hypothetical protein